MAARAGGDTSPLGPAVTHRRYRRRRWGHRRYSGAGCGRGYTAAGQCGYLEISGTEV